MKMLFHLFNIARMSVVHSASLHSLVTNDDERMNFNVA